MANRQTPPPMMGMRGRRDMPMNVEKPKNMRKVLKRLMQYIGKNKYLFISLVLVMVAITLLNLAAPALQGRAIDAVTLDGNKLSLDFDTFIRMLVLLGATYLFNALFQYLQGIFSAKLSQSTVRNMRRDLFGRIVRLPIRYFDTHQHGDIMSRMTNDVENISNSVSQSIGSLVSGVMTVGGTVAIMLYYSPVLTAISMITVIMTIFTTMFMSKRCLLYTSCIQGCIYFQLRDTIIQIHTDCFCLTL